MRRVPAETINGKRVIKRYLGALKKGDRTERAKEIADRREQARKGNYSYKPFKTDEGVKTSPSKYTLEYRRRFKNGPKK